MSYTITDLITRAATVCTTLGYTMNKNNVGGTDVADLGNINDFNREQGQDATGVLLVIDDNIQIEEMPDYVNEISLLILIHTRKNEADNLSKAASLQNVRAKLDAFLNSFCVRGTVDDMNKNRVYKLFTNGMMDGWSSGSIEIKVRVTNCP